MESRGFPVNISNLMEAIGKKDMSMEALARQADVDRTTIYHLQKGKNASPEVLKNLSKCLGMELEDLIMNPKDVLKAKRKLVEVHIGRANPEEVERLWDLIEERIS